MSSTSPSRWLRTLGGRNTRSAIVVVLLVALITAVAIVSSSNSASSSINSVGPLGWRASAAILEHEGVHTVSLDAPLAELEAASEGPSENAASQPSREQPTLVLGLPFQYAAASWDAQPYYRALRRGGTVVVAYAGNVLSLEESSVLDSFGLSLQPRNTKLPINPFAARRVLRRGERYASSEPDRAPLVAPILSFVPTAPSNATLLYEDRDQLPVAFSFRYLAGDVWVIPATALANAYIENAGNLELLLGMRDALGSTWWFDELHHGLVGNTDSESEAVSATRRRTVDLILLHSLLIYVLAAIAIGWRFGPPWPKQPSVEDSHRDLLIGMGQVHHSLGHHRDAARALVERIADYDPRIPIPDAVEERLASLDAKGFVALAAELSLRAESPD